MSNKERILQLINGMPDNKLIFIINMLESLKGYAGEEIEPDEWDLEMLEQAKKINDGTYLTLDEVRKEFDVEV
jgi:hypothetical protein|nr:MAG TPA: hypothetical protein [Caudoviricetes sp.]